MRIFIKRYGYEVSNTTMHKYMNKELNLCDECGTQISMSESDAELFDGACCTRNDCNGHMHIAEDKGLDFYGKLYSQGELVRIVAKEHTGLIYSLIIY